MPWKPRSCLFINPSEPPPGLPSNKGLKGYSLKMSAKEIQENHNLTEGRGNSDYRSPLLSQDKTKALLCYPAP